MRFLLLAGLLVLVLVSFIRHTPEHQHEHRSTTVLHAFQHANPCPSTGRMTGACPGYIKDHIVALCDGGADAVGNLQWQTIADAKAKDRTECHRNR